MNFKLELQKAIIKAIKKEYNIGLKLDEVLIDHPQNEFFGDYSSSIVLQLLSYLKNQSKNIKPDQICQKICKNLSKQSLDFIDKVSCQSNFINISIKSSYLVNQALKVLNKKEKFGYSDILKSKKIMIEFAHPNTHKSFHIGHLRNITTGESLVRILKTNKTQVIRANYQGDVGMHIAKAIYGLITSEKNFDLNKADKLSLDQKIDLLAKSYVQGSKAFKEDKKAQTNIKDINFLVYAAAQKFWQEKDKDTGSTDYLQFVKGKKFKLNEIYELWKETRQWSLDYFDTIYKRVYSTFDKLYFESQCLSGIDKVKQALKKGILTKSKGAIVFDGRKYNLDTRVFVNSLGLPTYEGKELALADIQFSQYPDLTKLIHVVAPEQKSFFKVTFKVEQLLNIQKNQQEHLAYGWVRLKKGKMSSRLGNIIEGEWLLNEAKKQIKQNFPKTSNQTAEQIAVAAVKYSFLKQGIEKDMAFDFKESISLQGNSGPYLQYTHARCQSVLKKAKTKLKNISKDKIGNYQPNDIEMTLLKWFYQFEEVTIQAAKSYSPSNICTYLYELAQRFNAFYNQHRILGSKKENKTLFRLVLTQATGQILKNGLYLLGIKAPDKM
jgi:arginyl-tRNA synthetase